jgi:hypothetical protein
VDPRGTTIAATWPVKNHSRFVLLPLAFVGACTGSEALDAETSLQDVVVPLCAAPCTVTVNLDGSFTPSNVTVNEGDSITFVAASGKLRTTDAVVRVGFPELTAATTTSCMTTSQPYDATHTLPGDDNELTGPLRRGTSGIYALGPEDSDGFYEGTTAMATCNDVALAAGGQVPVAGESWDRDGDGLEDAEIVGSGKLCRKYKRNGKPSNTNSQFILQSTWNNPDVTGGVVRINWRDLYKETAPGTGIYIHDYSKLDTELENAAQRGKLVFLEVIAGDGIPEWLFKDTPTRVSPIVDSSQTELVAHSVLPIETQDFGTSNKYVVSPTDCGYERKMGSPGDPNYQAAMIATITDVTAHIRASSAHFQALASLKVTGLNFLTGEMRLPKRCLSHTDPTDGAANASCWCNTRIWATTQNWAAPVSVNNYIANPLNGDAPAKSVWAGGYTEANAQAFMTAVENAIFVGLGRRKTMHFMLIQDGFPKVTDALNFEDEDPVAVPNYTNSFDFQTNLALENGRNGLFRTFSDPDAPSLFSTMNAALGPLPVDPVTMLPDPFNLATVGCKQVLSRAVAVANGKMQGLLAAPVANPLLADFSSGGCPNKWANVEGRRGQITGYQTTNDLISSDELSSALWNETLNTNAVFLEAYELSLWRALMEKTWLGNTFLSTSTAGFAGTADTQKSLADWTAELHGRRRTIANYASNAANRHMSDPFPDQYIFNFKKNLDPAVVLSESYYFINPAGRCTHPSAPQTSNLNYGKVTVLAK